MYQSHSLNISDAQKASLQQGDTIFLEPRHFNGDVEVPLTTVQMSKIKNSKRGFKLKMSSRQMKQLMLGEGWFSDKVAQYLPAIKKRLIPEARKLIDEGLDHVQAMIPTARAGEHEGLAKMAVTAGRSKINSMLDHIQKMFGGRIGIAKIDAQYGQGWFKDKLLPALETAAKIATPFIKKGGSINDVHELVDEQYGEGWFSNLLAATETAAKIAGPLMTGKGLTPHSRKTMTGLGWFDSIMKVVAPIARIGSNFLPGPLGGVARTGLSMMGQGMKKNPRRKADFASDFNLDHADFGGRGLEL